MSTLVQHHRVVSLTMQNMHFDKFTVLELRAIDKYGCEVLIELFSDPGGITLTFLVPAFKGTPTAQVAEAQS